MKTFKIAKALAACALALTIAACGGAGTYEQALLEEASGIKVTAENAGSDQEATTEGAIEVEEGDTIVISPDTTKGSFHLTITSADGGKTIYDDDVEGRVLFTTAAEPGTYDVTTSGNGVTGSMTVFAQSQEELLEQDTSLAEALDEVEADAEAATED